MKFCGKCEKNKKAGDFHKNKARKDGLQYYCKKCRRKYNIKEKQKIEMAVKVLK
ncbi:hypothetical protein LCGC14_3011900, partial [marine sediment metagenome]